MDSRGVHLNLIESSRQLFELDRGAALEVQRGWLFGAGTPNHPAISNAAFRIDDGLDAGELIAHALDFFTARGRGFCLWARGGAPEDRDLLSAAEAAGLQLAYEMPEMTLGRRVKERRLSTGVELRRICSDGEAGDYWRVAARAYASLGFPPEVFGSYDDHGGLWADNVAAFLALLDGEPAAIAMTIVTHGVAGIYWVGTLPGGRGRGLGWATTAAATNAGFDLGAEMASLQASSMGRPIYEAMGFERIFEYRLLISPPP